MNCEILRTLYVKANGEILCNDDQGEQVVLGIPDYESDSLGIDSLFANRHYDHIRASFANGVVPWPGICEKCAFLRRLEAFSGDLLSTRVIQKIQFESSLSCALRCPSCSNKTQLEIRGGPVHFPLEWMSNLLAELSFYSYTVQLIEFCGQGEPLNHPQFNQLLALTRQLMPNTPIRVITNGNHGFEAKIGSELVHEMLVSIDGATQESYVKYRVNGQIEKAFAFLRDSVRMLIPRGGRVVWKYILLTSNDSQDELIKAQEIAHEIGVSRLWFVHGHGDMKSTKHSFDNPLSVPVQYPNVKIESHPSYNSHSHSINDIGPATHVAGVDGMLWIDTAVLHSNNTLTLTGWVNSQGRRLKTLYVGIDGGQRSQIFLDIRRDDVIAMYPEFKSSHCGFDVLKRLGTIYRSTCIQLRFCLVLSSGEKSFFRLDLAFHDAHV
jgi:organic radical activating enzyme